MQVSVNVVMYLIIFGLVVFVFLTEQADWKCPGVTNFLFNCEGEEGMPYKGSKPHKNDGCNELLAKINIAAAAQGNSIKWRRSFMLAVLITVIVFSLVLTPGKLPIWIQFYIVVIIITSILYFNMNYYDYHKYNIPRNYIKESTGILAQKINSDTC